MPDLRPAIQIPGSRKWILAKCVGQGFRGTSPIRHVDKEMDTFRFGLFGGPTLFFEGETVDLSPFQAALLGFVLGSPRSSASRADVLARFWPDEEESRARKRLNQLLYALKRRTAGQSVVEARGDRLHGKAGLIRTDVDEFHEALRAHHLRAAWSLLEHGFLPDLEGVIHRSFSDWIVERAAELAGQLKREAERRWIKCEREGDWSAAAGAAEVLLSFQPSDEGLLRRLMEAQARAGLSAEAESAFREFKSLAEAKTRGSWRPQTATAGLLEKIQTSDVHGGNPEPVRMFDSGDDPPLVGRREEKDLLRRTIRRVPHQSLRGILLLGEAGIGKTRLIREALQGIHMDGQQVLVGGAAELEQLIPLNPLIEAFSAAWVGEQLRELEEPWRTVLFGVMPSHYLGEGPIPEAPQIQPGSVPRRLFEAYHQLLLRLAGVGPLILVVEDIQWADQTTLTVLEFLLRRWDQGGLQLVASVRTEEVHRNPTLTPFLDTMRSCPDVLEVPVGELDRSTAEALIRALSPEPLPDDDVTYLHSLGGGNPFFLIDMTLEFLAGRVDLDSGAKEPLQIPLSIRQVLGRRLSQLSPEAEKVLGSLAVHTRPLPLQGIARVAHMPGPRCLAGLDQLSQFRLVVTRGPEVAIRHELIRQTVYQTLAEHTRAWLHGRVARYLLKSRDRPPVDELAVHFDRAGMAVEAREYALEAAARAESSGAIPETLRFLRIAREHTDDPEAVAELIGRMGHLHYLHQNLDEAAPLLELAAGRFRMRGQIGRALEAEVEWLDALAQTGRLPWRECLHELERVKAEARQRGAWKIVTKALDAQIHHFDHRGEIEGVRQILEEAGDCAELDCPEAVCKSKAILALNVYYGSPKAALVAARQAVAIAEHSGDNDLQLLTLNRLIVVLLYQGLLHTEEGTQALWKAEQRSQKSGDLNLKFFVKQNWAVWNLEIGRLDWALKEFLGLRSLLDKSKARHARTLLLLNTGEVHLALHDAHAARECFADADRLVDSNSPVAFRTIIQAGLGLCALHDGDMAEARRREEQMATLPQYWSFDPSVIASFKARMHLRRGDVAAADHLLEEVAEDVRTRLVTAWIKLVIERCRIRSRFGLGKLEEIVAPALEVAGDLGLAGRAGELRRMCS